jgi:ketosteroid isomerase-like protein
VSVPDEVAAWLEEMERCVRARDYSAARSLFDTKVVGYGTREPVAHGLDELEEKQWRQVWPATEGFKFRIESARCASADGTVAVAVEWDSLGLSEDGGRFDRPGRATLVLREREGRLVAVHSHFSLRP